MADCLQEVKPSSGVGRLGLRRRVRGEDVTRGRFMFLRTPLEHDQLEFPASLLVNWYQWSGSSPEQVPPRPFEPNLHG